MNYVGVALTIVTGMAWNDAVKSGIEQYFPSKSTGVGGKFVYAILLTVLSIIIMYMLYSVYDVMFTPDGVIPSPINIVIDDDGRLKSATNQILTPNLVGRVK